MLGGRALRTVLFPFVSAEIRDINLDHALKYGMLPRHYLIENPSRRIEAYISNYLIEEIKAEALTRNLATFNRFMEIAAISCGEQLNFNNIASECGVSSPTIKEYFTILEDTMLGYMIPAFRKKVKRRLVLSPRFYYFDIGITNFLLKRTRLALGSPEYGKAFEHFIILELVAYLEYTNSRAELTYWRTSSGLEVDAVLGDANVAIEIKSAREIQNHHLKGLKAFGEEYPGARKILVSNEKYARRVNNIELIPVYPFLEQLWTGSII
jgi:predicted AAA+ superfamily ATPase